MRLTVQIQPQLKRIRLPAPAVLLAAAERAPGHVPQRSRCGVGQVVRRLADVADGEHLVHAADTTERAAAAALRLLLHCLRLLALASTALGLRWGCLAGAVFVGVLLLLDIGLGCGCLSRLVAAPAAALAGLGLGCS